MAKIEPGQARVIGNRLREAFERLGYKQSSLEQLTGVDQSQISRILKGDFRVTSPNVCKLCKYANVELAEIVGGALQAVGDSNQGHKIILTAFERVWDGSAEHARALGELMLATRNLRNSSTHE